MKLKNTVKTFCKVLSSVPNQVKLIEQNRESVQTDLELQSSELKLENARMKLEEVNINEKVLKEVLPPNSVKQEILAKLSEIKARELYLEKKWARKKEESSKALNIVNSNILEHQNKIKEKTGLIAK